MKRPRAAVRNTHEGVSSLLKPGAVIYMSRYDAVVNERPIVVTTLGAIQGGTNTRHLSARGLRMYL